MDLLDHILCCADIWKCGVVGIPFDECSSGYLRRVITARIASGSLSREICRREYTLELQGSLLMDKMKCFFAGISDARYHVGFPCSTQVQRLVIQADLPIIAARSAIVERFE